jgi:hypothetical protein
MTSYHPQTTWLHPRRIIVGCLTIILGTAALVAWAVL